MFIIEFINRYTNHTNEFLMFIIAFNATIIASH